MQTPRVPAQRGARSPRATAKLRPAPPNVRVSRPAFAPEQRTSRRRTCGLLFACALLPAICTSRSTAADPPIASLTDRARAARLAAFLISAREWSDQQTQEVRLGPFTTTGTTPEPRWVNAEFKAFESDWQPYTGAFAHQEASHLLGRTVIGARFSEIDAAVERGLDATVDHLLEARPLPSAPGPWATQPHPDTEGWSDSQIDSLYSAYWERRDPLRLWWVQNMLDSDDNLTESMTLFWHDHFATSIDVVGLPQSMYLQNQVLREHALGNVKELVYEIATDPAMLIWLDGQYNRKGDINENFGRELLELFTIGIGHYTENDVRAAARSCTGWITPDGVTSVFVPEWFDNGNKTFLGQSGNWDMADIVDIIFEQDETARHLCRKLYRWYVDENPSDALIEDLAQTMRDNDYEVRPVLDKMFHGRQFYHLQLRGSLITDGIDRTVGPLRSLEVEDIDLRSPWNAQSQWVLFSMWQFGMVLFTPPDVSGWQGYRAWLNSTTLPWRETLDAAAVRGEIDGWDLKMKANVFTWAEQLRDPNDAELLIEDLSIQLFGMMPTPTVEDALLQALLQGSEPWEWSLYYPESEARLRETLELAVRLPDYQVK